MNYSIETLEKAKTNLNNIINCIDDIEKGVDEKIACVKNNVKEYQLRKILLNNNRITKYVPTAEEEIYQHIIGTQLNPEEFPSDLKETIPYIIKEYLNPEEQDILDKIYWKGESYTELANKYNLKVLGIKKIEKAALDKLKKDRPLFIIEYGINFTNEIEKLKTLTTIERRKKAMEKYMFDYTQKQEELLDKLKTKLETLNSNIKSEVESEMQNIKENI